jgi:hypothetical protein
LESVWNIDQFARLGTSVLYAIRFELKYRLQPLLDRTLEVSIKILLESVGYNDQVAGLPVAFPLINRVPFEFVRITPFEETFGTLEGLFTKLT